MNPKTHSERATFAAAALVICGFAAWWYPGLIAAHPWLAGTVGGLALLYFVVGVVWATAEPDPLGRFWPFVVAAGSGFLIWKFAGFLRDDWPWLNVLLIATGAASGVRFAVAMKPMPNKSLPHPSKVPLMPMAGPASMQAAHAALTRGRGAARPWWKFW